MPIIRPLVLLNQTDQNTFTLRHTYHFGNEFLVAPMIAPNANARQVYLPAGNWIDFWNNTTHPGGQNFNWTNTNQSQFPLFVREGAIVPMLLNEADSLNDANYINNGAIKTRDNGLLFLIYPGGHSGFTVYDGTNVQCAAGAGGTRITLASTARAIELQVLGGTPAAVERDGAALPQFTSAAAFDAAERAGAQTRKPG